MLFILQFFFIFNYFFCVINSVQQSSSSVPLQLDTFAKALGAKLCDWDGVSCWVSVTDAESSNFSVKPSALLVRFHHDDFKIPLINLEADDRSSEDDTFSNGRFSLSIGVFITHSSEVEASIAVRLCDDDVVGGISWSPFVKSQILAGVEFNDWSNAVIDNDTLENESSVFKETSDSWGGFFNETRETPGSRKSFEAEVCKSSLIFLPSFKSWEDPSLCESKPTPGGIVVPSA